MRWFVRRIFDGAMLALFVASSISVSQAQQSSGSVEAQLQSAFSLFQGGGDSKKVLKMVEPAARSGNANAQYIAGIALNKLISQVMNPEKGNKVASAYLQKSRSYLEKAAEQDHPYAQRDISISYALSPLGRNTPRASFWFDKFIKNRAISDEEKVSIVNSIRGRAYKETERILTNAYVKKQFSLGEAVLADMWGTVFFHGSMGVEENKKKAERLFLAAHTSFEMDQKNVQKYIQGIYINTRFYIGYLMYSQDDNPEYKKSGAILIQEAAKNGNVLAREILNKFSKNADHSYNDDSAKNFGPVEINLSPRQSESEIDYNLRLSLVSFLRAQYFMTKALGLNEKVSLIQNTIEGLGRGDLGAESNIKKIVTLSKSLQDEIDKKMEAKVNLTKAERELFVQSLPNYFHGLFRLYRLVKSSIDFAHKSKDMIQANWISAFGIVMQALKVFDTLPTLLTRFQSSSGAILAYATSNGIDTDKIEKASEGLF